MSNDTGKATTIEHVASCMIVKATSIHATCSFAVAVKVEAQVKEAEIPVAVKVETQDNVAEPYRVAIPVAVKVETQVNEAEP